MPTERPRTNWTLGTVAGPNTLTVTISGVGGDDQRDRRGRRAPRSDQGQHRLATVVASSSTPLVVRAVDQFNNPVPGIDVNWTASGGTLTSATTATGSSGNAQVTFTTDVLPATYTITAVTTGFAPVTFTLTGR